MFYDHHFSHSTIYYPHYRHTLLENALKHKGISKEFEQWFVVAKDRSKWRQMTHSNPKPPDA